MKSPAKNRFWLERWRIACAVIGLAGSVIAVLSGGLLSISAWLAGD